MALGTNCARCGRKQDLATRYGLELMIKHGASREEAEAAMKELRKLTVAEMEKKHWELMKNRPAE